ncbi:spore germination protein KA [Scopulibacillus darangshiensis]|uniref:Spore germination protein KA n=1 Tax=Scopulibacillus darangshiensis TaxID=442528 RepID=A0A4R2P399_9BACL|nr:spore germination protein KA [Scopulibacillus darangshiensis]
MLKRSWRKSEKGRKMQKTEYEKKEQDSLSNSFNNNVQNLRDIYKNCSDVVFRPFFIAGKGKAILVYIEGLANTEEIDDNVLSPLMQESTEYDDIKTLLKKRIAVSNVKELATFSDCVDQISIGNPVILIDGRATGFSLDLSKWEQRSVEEPSAEQVIRGPREGFIETLQVNSSMLRRKIRSPEFKMQAMEVGRYTKTKVIIAYMDGIVNKTLLEEVNNRLKRIDIDGVLESGIIEEFIEDNPYSPFPQLLTTERPDVAAANLLEGRVVIMVDGTPFVMIAPTTLYSFFQSNEDYYSRFLIASLIRWLRYFLVVMSLLLPSLYVAVLTFHQEMLPTTLIISVAASREQVPFPALVEALIMEITFEALREAGLRLPKQVGSAVSIVGALVIGESAVQAGIISAPMVIVVSFTGIASFTIPRYSAAIAIRMLRFPMIFLAGTLGLLGIMLGIITIIVHLCTLRSFGVPYLSPMAPMNASGMKDVLIRAPWWSLRTRPHFTGGYNRYRQPPDQKPGPKKGKEK